MLAGVAAWYFVLPLAGEPEDDWGFSPAMPIALLSGGVVTALLRHFAIRSVGAKLAWPRALQAALFGVLLWCIALIGFGWLFIGSAVVVFFFPLAGLLILPLATLILGLALEGPLRLYLASTRVKLGGVMWGVIGLGLPFIGAVVNQLSDDIHFDVFTPMLFIGAGIYGWMTAPRIRTEVTAPKPSLGVEKRVESIQRAPAAPGRVHPGARNPYADHHPSQPLPAWWKPSSEQQPN